MDLITNIIRGIVAPVFELAFWGIVLGPFVVVATVIAVVVRLLWATRIKD